MARKARLGSSKNPGFVPPKRTAKGKAVSANTQHARGEGRVRLKPVRKI